ncbi:MAG: ornithine carbamoyltransferase [Lactobacillales bacterium]|jgi:ornithine carbamoyltransferase|nr:ornithine carbamoyltransferase [Lactobacillales bacterium]
MANPIFNKDLLDLTELSKAEFLSILDLASDFRANPAKYSQALKGKVLAMIFEKSSTRTRVSFESGMYRLGGNAVVLDAKNTQIARGEPTIDTANVLAGMVDAIMIRTFSDDMVAELAHYSSVPVINALTDLHHPCQILADFQTIQEVHGTTEGVKIAYIGDGNNMAHSYLLGATILGMDVSIATPAEYAPNAEIVAQAKKIAEESGSVVEIVIEPADAVKDADFIFTDVWASMGDEEEFGEREKVFAGKYQVNSELVKLAKDDYYFMHCLPAHRGEEVTAEIIDDPKHSLIYHEAHNRLYAQGALLMKLLLEDA